MGSEQRRRGRRVAGSRVKAWSHVHGKDQLHLQVGCGLERHNGAQASVPKPPPVHNHRRVVEGKCAGRTEHVDQWSIAGPRAKEHQLPGIEIHGGDRQGDAEVGKAAGGNDGLDGGSKRFRLEQGAKKQSGYRRPAGSRTMPRGPSSAIRSSSSSFPIPLARPAATTAPIEVATYQVGSNPASFRARQAPRWAAVLAPPPLSTTAADRVKAALSSGAGSRRGSNGRALRWSPAPGAEPVSAYPPGPAPRRLRGRYACAAAHRC